MKRAHGCCQSASDPIRPMPPRAASSPASTSASAAAIAWPYQAAARPCSPAANMRLPVSRPPPAYGRPPPAAGASSCGPGAGRSPFGTLANQAVETSGEFRKAGFDPFTRIRLPGRWPAAVKKVVTPAHDIVVEFVGNSEHVRRDGSGQGDSEIRHQISAFALKDQAKASLDLRPRPRLRFRRAAAGEALE